jgi:hypothetical protein
MGRYSVNHKKNFTFAFKLTPNFIEIREWNLQCQFRAFLYVLFKNENKMYGDGVASNGNLFAQNSMKIGQEIFRSELIKGSDLEESITMFLNPFCHAQDTSMKTLVLLT